MLELSNPPPAFRDALADLAALGVIEDRRLGMAFGVIGARSNARWLILPLGDRRQTKSGFDLFKPASASAQAAKTGARTLCRLGLQRLVSKRRLHLTGVDKVAARLLGRASACAIFTGTDGPHRKTAIQLMEAGGAILGYAKITRRSQLRPYLAHEAQMLGRVQRLKLTSAETPILLTFEADDATGLTILVTDSQQTGGHRSPREPGLPHLRFLTELARRTAGVGAESALDELARLSPDPRLPEEWARRFRMGLEHLAPLVSTMPVALAHGDFTPWNSFVIGERIYVFDWEYAAEGRPLGYDLIHYLLASAGALKPEATVCWARSRVAEVFYRGDEAAAAAALLLSLLLHASFYLRREFDVGGNAQEWAGAAGSGARIDVLLGGEPK